MFPSSPQPIATPECFVALPKQGQQLITIRAFRSLSHVLQQFLIKPPRQLTAAVVYWLPITALALRGAFDIQSKQWRVTHGKRTTWPVRGVNSSCLRGTSTKWANDSISREPTQRNFTLFRQWRRHATQSQSHVGHVRDLISDYILAGSGIMFNWI